MSSLKIILHNTHVTEVLKMHTHSVCQVKKSYHTFLSHYNRWGRNYINELIFFIILIPTFYIKMIIFLDFFEDPKIPFLGPNYWILKKMGFLLPRSNTGKTIYIIMHAIVALFVVTQFIELYVVRSDLNQVLNNMTISMLSSICIVKVYTFVYWQTSWREVLGYVNEADKIERNNNDIAKGPIIISTYTKYSHRVTSYYWLLVFVVGVLTIISPHINFMSPTFRENFRNGTEMFPHQFSSWMPFDKNYPPGSWITILWHTCMCVYGAGILAAYDTSIVVIMVFFGGKLDLLRERYKQIFGDGDNNISNIEFKRVVRELHQMHLLLIKYSRLFNSLVSPVMFVYTMVCSLMICASAFQFTSTNNVTQKLLCAPYLIHGIAQLFIFCWHSNDVLIKNENVSLGLYESNWWAANPQQRKTMLLLLGQLQIVNVFTAGPFVDLTLSTFIMILKGAYSYYTLLRD